MRGDRRTIDIEREWTHTMQDICRSDFYPYMDLDHTCQSNIITMPIQIHLNTTIMLIYCISYIFSIDSKFEKIVKCDHIYQYK